MALVASLAEGRIWLILTSSSRSWPIFLGLVWPELVAEQYVLDAH